MRATFWSLLRNLTRLAVLPLLFVVSLVLHLPTNLGRAAATDLARAAATDFAPGHITLRHITRLAPGGLVVTGLTWRDLDQRVLVHEAKVTVTPLTGLIAALVTGARWPAIDVDARTINGFVPRLSEPAMPGEARPASPLPTMRFPRLTLHAASLHNRVGFPIDASDLRVALGVGLQPAGMSFNLRSLTLQTRTTPLSPVSLQARARVRTYPALTVDAGLSLAGAPLRCTIAVVPQANGDTLGTLHDCFLPGTTLTALAALDPTQQLPDVAIPDLAAHGRLGESWTIDGHLVIGHATTALTAFINGNDRSATLSFDHVTLRDAYDVLPDGKIDGVIAITEQDVGIGQRLTVDARNFHAIVANNDVPPFLVTALYRANNPLVIEHFDVPMVLLSATGTVGLDVPHRIDLYTHFDPPPIETLPWTRTLGRGRVRGHAHITGDPSDIHVDATVIADALSVATARVRHGQVHAALTIAGDTRLIDAAASLQGVAVRGAVDPSDAEVHVVGNLGGVLRVRATTQGAGLLRALGPTPANVPNNASVAVDATVDLSTPDYIAARVTQLRLNLRGANASIRGAIAFRPSRALATARGTVNVDAGASGSIALGLGGGRVNVHANRFDLAWAAPLVPSARSLGGHIDGELALDLADIDRSHGALTLRDLTIPEVGSVTADLNVSRRAEDLVVQVAGALLPPNAQQPATFNLEAVTAPVHDAGDVAAWTRAIRTVTAHVLVGDLEHFALLRAALPRSVRLQGRFEATANVARATPSAPLVGTVGVEARSLVVGLGVPSLLSREPRVIPAVYPMWARGVACVSLASLRVDDIAPRLKFAITRDYNETSAGPPTACDAQPLMPRTLVATDLSLQGPWQTALSAAAEAISLRGTVLPAQTRQALAAASVDWSLSFGPILRSEWPLRTVAIPQADGTPRFIRPPDVPPATMLHAEVHARGTFLAPSIEAEVESSAPSLMVAGLNEPVRADVFASISPPPQGTLLDAWVVNLGLRGVSSPNAPRENQARVEADIRLSTRVAALRDEGVGGLSWDRFDVNSENLRVERFSWGRDRGLEGLVALDLLATDDPHQPVTANVTVHDFRARLPDALQGYVAPAVQARVHAAVRNNGGHLELRSCAVASTASATPECSFDAALPTTSSESVLMVATVPVNGTLPRVAPDTRGAVVDVIAAGYPLETLSRFVPDDVATDLGGLLEARIHWDGQHPNAPTGQIALHNGRATLTTLGEPMRALDLVINARDSAVQVDHVDFDLGRGHLHVNGNANIGDDHTAITLHGVTHTVPAVLSGYTWAWVDGAIDLSLDLTSDSLRGDITVERLSALVQDQPSGDVQTLGEDPNVFIVGRTRLARPGGAGNFAIDLGIHAQTPIWARRSDFAIAVRTDIRIHKDRAGLALAGTITQGSTQSWYAIFGKRFDIDRIGITFDGNLTMNPELDVAAHHDSPTAGRINVVVSGRLQRPSIVLSAESAPTASQAEILAMIILGRRSSAASSSGTDYAQQFAQAIVSLVSGIVASGVSRNFSFLPTIIAEPTTTGTGGRYGAGVNISPRLYIQATYSQAGSTTSTGTTSLVAEFRLLLEYAISEAITFAASGSSRGAGTADVYWSP